MAKTQSNYVNTTGQQIKYIAQNNEDNYTGVYSACCSIILSCIIFCYLIWHLSLKISERWREEFRELKLKEIETMACIKRKEVDND